MTGLQNKRNAAIGLYGQTLTKANEYRNARLIGIGLIIKTLNDFDKIFIAVTVFNRTLKGEFFIGCMAHAVLKDTLPTQIELEVIARGQ